MARFRVAYDRWLHERPLLTKGVTSAVLFGLGDRIAQRLEDSESTPDSDNGTDDALRWKNSLSRTARMMVWGGLLFAPVGHGWYNLLEKAVRGKGRAAVVKKIALDQLVFTPPVTLAFFSVMQCMEGESVDTAVQSSVAKVPPTLAVNWTVWPLIHVCTFGFVPLQYRILFINFANIGWSAFLSIMSSGGSDAPRSFKALVVGEEAEPAAI